MTGHIISVGQRFKGDHSVNGRFDSRSSVDLVLLLIIVLVIPFKQLATLKLLIGKPNSVELVFNYSSPLLLLRVRFCLFT